MSPTLQALLANATSSVIALAVVGATFLLVLRMRKSEASWGRSLAALALGLGLAVKTRALGCYLALILLVKGGAPFERVKFIQEAPIEGLWPLAWVVLAGAIAMTVHELRAEGQSEINPWARRMGEIAMVAVMLVGLWQGDKWIEGTYARARLEYYYGGERGGQ